MGSVCSCFEGIRAQPLGPPRPAWLAKRGRGNGNVPPKLWAMTPEQWNDIIMAFATCKEFSALVEEKGHVNLYDTNTHFIIPWTRGTGSGIALLMNSNTPIEASLMISHAWYEDILEAHEAVNNFCKKQSSSPNLWFCAFANYQPEDGAGPSISEQLALKPFAAVIDVVQNKDGMLVINSMEGDLYSRLWCVYELDEAEFDKLEVKAAMSDVFFMSVFFHMVDKCFGGDAERLYETFDNPLHRKSCSELMVKEFYDRPPQCETASCGRKEDEDQIRAIIQGRGGFARLNELVQKKRGQLATQMIEDFRHGGLRSWTGYCPPKMKDVRDRMNCLLGSVS